MKFQLLAAVLAAAAPAWAQQSSPSIVTVTGNPWGDGEVATPFSVLSGAALVTRRGSSLGETIDGLPGVSSTYFGPNANRPVIRGQDGDRIRVLSNSGASLDASGLSLDHAVAIDPLVVERIEVLRGPAALMYGGSAVGGVVNTIDNRIPRSALSTFSGAVESRAGGAAGERALSAMVEGGGNGIALHADAFWRRTDDLRVPTFDRPLEGGGTERRNRIANSGSQAQGGALGASRAWAQGFLGVSVDTYRNDYGVVASEDTIIQMTSDKLALAGEWRAPGAPITVWRAQAAGTDYQHQEIEGGLVGTTFKTRGADARFEALHRPVSVGAGRLEGTLGAQWESSRFSALGEEAFVPSTQTRQAAGFVLERWTWGRGNHLSVGVRAERIDVRSAGDEDGSALRFGPAQERRFLPRSSSVSALVRLAPQWQLTASGSQTERAPTHYELYANGVHAATGVYERGATQQAMERGRNMDWALAWASGPDRIKIGSFDARFSNYIVLQEAGEPDFINASGERLPVYVFQGVRASLKGIEAEGQWRVRAGVTSVDLDAKFDAVKGRNLDSGEALPRLAPRRASVGLSLTHAQWRVHAEAQHAWAQVRVPSADVATPGFTLVHLTLSRVLRIDEREALLFVKLQNAGNTLAYSASTIGTVRSLAPRPGRGLTAGVRWRF